MADTKISGLSAVTDVLGTDEFVLARSGTTKKITGANLLLYDAYAYLRDEKTANTSGGTFTSGAWQTRTLNTEVSDVAGIVSLSSNQFTLAAGSYLIKARAPAYRVDRHKLRIRNITDSTDALIGSSQFSSSTDSSLHEATVYGRVTLSGTKALELQHQCQTSSPANFGFGVESNFGVVEVYAEVEIWRER